MKKRYCECGRELEKYQHYCSECGYIRQQISINSACHSYRQTLKYYNSLKKSNRKKIKSGYFKEYNKTEKRKAWRREYEKGRLEYKRAWQEKRRAA